MPLPYSITNVQVKIPWSKHDARKGSAGKSDERQARAAGSQVPPPSRLPTHTNIAFAGLHPPKRLSMPALLRGFSSPRRLPRVGEGEAPDVYPAWIGLAVPWPF